MAGEPVTEPGRRLLAGHNHSPMVDGEERWCFADDEPWPCPFAQSLAAIEAAAHREGWDAALAAVRAVIWETDVYWRFANPEQGHADIRRFADEIAAEALARLAAEGDRT